MTIPLANRPLAGALLAATALLAVSASPAAPPRATAIRIGDHPAYVRVVVDFSGGSPGANDVLLDGAAAFREGRAVLRIGGRSILAGAVPRALHGVSARLTRGAGGTTLRLAAAPRRFKHVSYAVLRRPARLAVDLWKAAPPPAAARVLNDGCVRLDGWSVGHGRFAARGRALQRLFENTLVITLRDDAGRVVRQHPLTLRAAPGAWRAWLRYRVSRPGRGTLEAWVGSAKDGALDCLVQVAVSLRP